MNRHYIPTVSMLALAGLAIGSVAAAAPCLVRLSDPFRYTSSRSQVPEP